MTIICNGTSDDKPSNFMKFPGVYPIFPPGEGLQILTKVQFLPPLRVLLLPPPKQAPPRSASNPAIRGPGPEEMAILWSRLPNSRKHVRMNVRQNVRIDSRQNIQNNRQKVKMCMYFRMVCQRLCQNGVSGRGSLEVKSFRRFRYQTAFPRPFAAEIPSQSMAACLEQRRLLRRGSSSTAQSRRCR